MSPRRTKWWLVAIAAVFAASLTCTGARADALLFHAVSSGEEALDRGEGGGNPFASALIETLKRPSLALGDLPRALTDLTHVKSKGRMMADVPAVAEPADWQLVPVKEGETRIALVLVVSDYSRAGAKSLPGARHDAERIGAALTDAGFAIDLALDLGKKEMEETLAEFRDASRSADVALIYTTGHGAEVDGRTYLIPADYPVKKRAAALTTRAMPLADIARIPAARSVNLVLYGGCRNNPFGGK